MKESNLGKEGTVGLITYMRTDSTRISDIAKAGSYCNILKTAYGKEFLLTEQRKEKKQTNAQDAHEAVRPTSAYVNQASKRVFISRSIPFV